MNNDLISREALKKAACVKFYITPYYKHILDLIDNAPPVDEWIPVSERLPEERGMYLVTEKEFAIGDRNHSGKFKVKTEQVEFHDGKWNRAKFYEVIAWQPLPEPYKKEGEEE